jgi:hypothetical protein
VLGCTDRMTICSPDGSVCGSWKYWHGLGRSDTEDYRVQAALTWSLMYSNIGLAINFGLGNALDAMRKISGGASLPLAPEQWKVEAQNLFNTSLARIQIDARNIARGNPNGNYPGMVDIMNPMQRDICKMYKFKSTGWRNIVVSGFRAALWTSIVFIIISIPITDEHKAERLWIEIWFKLLCKTIYTACVFFIKNIVNLFNILKSLFKTHISERLQRWYTNITTRPPATEQTDTQTEIDRPLSTLGERTHTSIGDTNSEGLVGSASTT